MPQDAAPEIADFRWIRQTTLRDAGCITLVHAIDPAEVVRDFGGIPGRAVRTSLPAAEDLSLDARSDELLPSQWLGVRSLGPWTLAVEVNGWQGSRPEVLGRLSAGTRAVSVYWNESAGTRFSYAVGGHVVTAFDAVFPDRREGADPDALETLRAGLTPDDGDEVPMMLALAARVAGVTPTPDWLAGDFDVAPVEPLPEAVRPAIYPDSEALTYLDPPLAWALRHAADGPLRDAALAAAWYAARATGLADRPEVAAALRPDASASPAELDRLLAGSLRMARKSAGDPRAGARYWAASAVREAANPLPLAAAFRAAEAARSAAEALGLGHGALRAEVLGVLGDPRPPSGSMGLVASPGPLPADAYAWTSAHWLATVGAVTFLRGSAADAAYALGPGPDGAGVGIPALFSDPIVAIREQDGWSVAVESHERLGPFAHYESLPSRTVTITWSARGQARLHYSDAGRLLVMLDPQSPEQVTGADPGVLDGHLGGLRLGPTGTGAAACLPALLVLAERLTGVPFDPGLLDRPHLLVRRPGRLG